MKIPAGRLSVSVLLGISFMLILPGCFAEDKNEYSYNKVLQLLYTDQNDRCYEISVHVKVVSRPIALDRDAYEFSDVSVEVIRHGIGYQRHRILFQKTFGGVYKYSGTTQLPTWDGKYVPSKAFLLPSARLARSDNSLLLVLYDGSKHSCFVLNQEQTEFIPLANPLAQHREVLRSLWHTSFSPVDVYWSYGLVAQASFFGFHSKEVNFANFIDTAYLHELYNSIKR